MRASCNLSYEGVEIYEPLTIISIGRFEIRTSNNLPCSGVIICKYLTTFPIGAL